MEKHEANGQRTAIATLDEQHKFFVYACGSFFEEALSM